MVIAAHPDDAEFGPAGTAARWIDAGSVGLARVLHQRRPGRRGSDRGSIRPGCGPRARAARGCRGHRVRGGRLPAQARRRAGQRPATARTARPGDPDVPAGRRPGDRPGDRLLRRRRREPHGPPRGRAGRGRRRLPGSPQPDDVSRGSPATAWPPTSVRRIYLFWSNHPTRLGRHRRRHWTASSRRSTNTAARSPTRTGSTPGSGTGRSRRARPSERRRQKRCG